ncbi:hypothetical protein SLS60_009205 [Paraconiothyrium brasiliense]|uniref:EthD domain-containing protein n=1 Tax=Paraconiothyrium brasiliense TaxID=300254 RepID=A0ABR3QWP2_9PLEO
MSTEELIRITVLVNRRPGMSEDDFNKYWAYEHGPLATDWLQQIDLTVSQYHTTSKHKALGKRMFDATGRSPLSYDGMGDFWVRKYEDFEAAFLDPYYQKVIQPDEKKLICMDTISVTIGVEYVVIDNGEIVRTHARSF